MEPCDGEAGGVCGGGRFCGDGSRMRRGGGERGRSRAEFDGVQVDPDYAPADAIADSIFAARGRRTLILYPLIIHKDEPIARNGTTGVVQFDLFQCIVTSKTGVTSQLQVR